MRPLARTLLLALALALGSLAASAQVMVNGVRYEESIDLRGNKLQLNGAGTRYRGPFKVYAAGLYLPRKAGTPDEVLALAGARRISVTMLREIDAADFGKLLTRGVEDNLENRATMNKLVPGLLRLGQMFAEYKKLQPGDTFTIDWLPGTGTIITVRGQPQGEPLKEPEFFNALLRIWLGPSPADWKLKDALLGKPA